MSSFDKLIKTVLLKTLIIVTSNNGEKCVVEFCFETNFVGLKLQG